MNMKENPKCAGSPQNPPKSARVHRKKPDAVRGFAFQSARVRLTEKPHLSHVAQRQLRFNKYGIYREVSET
jgi:hypothetical protein